MRVKEPVSPVIQLDFPDLLRQFEVLPDPRIDRTKKFTLPEVIGITLIATICGANNWAEIARFAMQRHQWLQNFLPLPNGTPSHDTIARIFSIINPEVFSECFSEWLRSVKVHGKHLNIDGKTIRGTRSIAKDKPAVHVVSAWLSEAGISLGQVAVTDKSNEIEAIPRLLEIINVKGKIITIDAMGCQKEIAKNIIEKRGDYVLALKGNQGNLHKSISMSFDGATHEALLGRVSDSYETIEKNHGRIEHRRTYVVHDVTPWLETNCWNSLNTVIIVDRTTDHLSTQQKSHERQYYISSLVETNAKDA